VCCPHPECDEELADADVARLLKDQPQLLQVCVPHCVHALNAGCFKLRQEVCVPPTVGLDAGFMTLLNTSDWCRPGMGRLS
jgi:hypothetical protein